MSARGMCRLARGALLLAGIVLSTSCATAPAPDAEFEVRLRDAGRNAGSAEGTMFEAGVVAQYRQPPIRDRLRACLAADASAPTLTGLLVFLAPGGYQLELRPRGPTSDCVSQAIAAEHLPEPPRYPYSIPFRWPRDL